MQRPPQSSRRSARGRARRLQATRLRSLAEATRHLKLLFFARRRGDGGIDLLGPQPAQEAEREQAVQAQKFAETEKAVRENYFTTIALAQTKINESQYAQARELLWSAPQKNGHWEWDRLMRLCQSAMITLQGHKGAVDSSTFYLERKALGYCKS